MQDDTIALTPSQKVSWVSNRPLSIMSVTLRVKVIRIHFAKRVSGPACLYKNKSG
jgi:hypothetical protein